MAASRASSDGVVRKYASWKAVTSAPCTLTLVWGESAAGTTHAGRGASVAGGPPAADWPEASAWPEAAAVRARGAESRPPVAACCPDALAPERVRPAEVGTVPAVVVALRPEALERLRRAGAMMERRKLESCGEAVIKQGGKAAKGKKYMSIAMCVSDHPRGGKQGGRRSRARARAKRRRKHAASAHPKKRGGNARCLNGHSSPRLRGRLHQAEARTTQRRWPRVAARGRRLKTNGTSPLPTAARPHVEAGVFWRVLAVLQEADSDHR